MIVSFNQFCIYDFRFKILLFSTTLTQHCSNISSSIYQYCNEEFVWIDIRLVFCLTFSLVMFTLSVVKQFILSIIYSCNYVLPYNAKKNRQRFSRFRFSVMVFYLIYPLWVSIPKLLVNDRPLNYYSFT